MGLSTSCLPGVLPVLLVWLHVLPRLPGAARPMILSGLLLAVPTPLSGLVPLQLLVRLEFLPVLPGSPWLHRFPVLIFIFFMRELAPFLPKVPTPWTIFAGFFFIAEHIWFMFFTA